MVEELIRSAGHKCIFLPKFHCELNPIEMVSGSYIQRLPSNVDLRGSTGAGASFPYREGIEVKFCSSQESGSGNP